MKDRLFAAMAEHLEQGPGVQKSEWGIVVIDTGRDNWWAYRRLVNAQTGYDERMAVGSDGETRT